MFLIISLDRIACIRYGLFYRQSIVVGMSVSLSVCYRGGSRSRDWRRPYGERGARAYKRGLGLCPHVGPGAEPLVRGRSPPEAERFLVLSYV